MSNYRAHFYMTNGEVITDTLCDQSDDIEELFERMVSAPYAGLIGSRTIINLAHVVKIEVTKIIEEEPNGPDKTTD